MADQITIDGTNVDGVDGRTINGQIINQFSSDGLRTIECGLIITGSTSTDLQDKWETAKEALQVRDKRITVTLDTSATNNYEDIFPGDGVTQSNFCWLTIDPTEPSTDTVLYCRLVIAAQQGEFLPTSTSTPSGDNTLPQFKGQIGSYKLTTMYSEARTESRALLINVGTVYDKEAYGPLTINTVESAGGKARFVLASLGGITSFTDDMKLYVSGTTNYNGTHIITSIDVGNLKITTDTTFTATDTGTCLVGEATRPEDVYAEIKTSLLDLVGVDADGDRNATTGLALAGETIDRTNEGLTILLQSEWVEKEYHEAIRGLQIGIERYETPEWHQDAGTRPVVVNAVVVFAVDRDKYGSDNPYPLWNTIRSDVIADIKTNISEGDAEGPWQETIKMDQKTGMVEVGMQFIAKNTDIISFRKVTQEQEELDYVAWRDSQGFDYVQVPPGAKPKIISISVEKVSKSQSVVTIDPPTEAGFKYIDITTQVGSEGPITR